MRRRSAWLALPAAGLAVLAGAAAASTSVAAAPARPADNAPGAAARPAADPRTASLPPGWTLSGTAAGRRLVWSSPRLLPVGDARVDVRAGTTRLGTGVVAPDRRSLSLDLPAAALPADLSGLQVLAAGRRLDADPAGDPGAARTGAGDSVTLPPALPAAAVDPGKPGPYRTTTGEYDLPTLRIAGLPARVEVRAVVVSPTTAPGRRPLVLFLHGRHATCYKGKEDSGAWPCPAGWAPIPSHRGYLQTQQLLASQGYDTVSISADGINGQDGDLPDGGEEARSALVRHHLALWTAWASGASRSGAPAIVRATPPADVRNILLVGHSRGGEGVNRAAIDSVVSARTGRPSPWHVSGLFHLAPTAFGQNPAAGVPTVVVLPTCDGDVYDLQGQQYVDRMRDVAPDGALRSSVLVVGADHNFFNREWTPGEAQAPASDDWGDTSDAVCGTRRGNVRLSAAAQRTVGASYVAAAARAFLARDAAVLPLLDGSGVRPASVGRARVLVAALGGRRHPVAVAGSDLARAPAVRGAGGVKAAVCEGFSASAKVVTCPDLLAVQGVYPHFLQLGLPSEPAPRGVGVRWSRAAGQAVVPGPVTSLAGDADLALRIVVPAGSTGTRFAVALTDAGGHGVVLRKVTLTGLPRSASVATHWAQEVRIPLAGVRGVDLRHITAVRLLPVSRSGRLVLLDAWGHRPGVARGPALVLPRLDAPTVSVPEGNGVRRVTVTFRVSGPSGPGPRSFWLGVLDYRAGGAGTGRLVTLGPRQRSFDLAIRVAGNSLHDDDVTIGLGIKPVRGLVAGEWSGQLVIKDDDPQPRVSASRVRADVTEGGTLRWRFGLDAVSGTDTYVLLRAAPPVSGPEASTDDVPVSWLQQWIVVPDRPTPLSAVPVEVTVTIPAGVTRAFLDVPTSADGSSEGTEGIAFTVNQALPGLPEGTRIQGTVADPG